jgi:hypothetical protein
MGLFIASPPIERRHTRQRIAEKPSRQIARLELGSAITIGQRQGTEPKARREHEVSGLAAASSFIQDFGHCSFPPYNLPKPQPYGTPAPWPNGDGRLTGLGPNMGTSTTLADLFTLLFAANPFSAAGASLWRWSSDEFEDGLAHGGQCRSRRRPVDSFFPALLF